MNAATIRRSARPSVTSRRLSVGAAAMVVAALIGASPAEAQQSPARADADRRCLQCHGQPHIAALGPAERRSMVGTRLDPGAAPPGAPSSGSPLTGDEPATRPGLLVTSDAFAAGPHTAVSCVECHTDAAELPHAPALRRATCASTCHAEAVTAYDTSPHRAALLRNDPAAPTCASCHGGHGILRVSDRNAPQHHLNSLHLCGDCHSQHSSSPREKNPAANVADYLDSAHARAVTKAGLATAATCADCHGAHAALPSDEPASPVNRLNIPKTCGKCHIGVAEVYATSVHGQLHAERNGDAPVCIDCHAGHRVTLASTPAFVRDVIEECGRCHDTPAADGDRTATYYETYHRSYHGQVTRLGGARAARCSDCHGAHDIRPLDDPDSRVSPANLVATCAACHPGANANFVKFDPHADHRDAERHPILHAVWLYFMIMMSAVFGFFGVHTILWTVRSLVDRARHGPPPRHAPATTAIRRFTTIDRVNHALVAITFFGLTATGIPLVFSDQWWARSLAGLFGGVEAAGVWHRGFAILLIANFVVHFVGLWRSWRRRTVTRRQWLFGPGSLIPRWKDIKDCFAMLRWFVGLGPRPKFDRWTYWEKFDYWAEVGGSVIIGGSGLLLWFPEIASKVIPGWAFNIAMIVHGYEALLAIGFIFTIHFFNAHLRPGTFPVDEVIFTGSLPEHELKEQRPEEFRRLSESGRLESLRVPAPDPSRRPAILVIAVVAVAFGLLLLALILLGGLS